MNIIPWTWNVNSCPQECLRNVYKHVQIWQIIYNNLIPCIRKITLSFWKSITFLSRILILSMFKTDKHSNSPPSYIKTVKNDQMSNANQLMKKQLPFISVTKENSNKVRALRWIFYLTIRFTICPTLFYFVRCKKKKQQRQNSSLQHRINRPA